MRNNTPRHQGRPYAAAAAVGTAAVKLGHACSRHAVLNPFRVARVDQQTWSADPRRNGCSHADVVEEQYTICKYTVFRKRTFFSPFYFAQYFEQDVGLSIRNLAEILNFFKYFFTFLLLLKLLKEFFNIKLLSC